MAALIAAKRRSLSSEPAARGGTWIRPDVATRRVLRRLLRMSPVATERLPDRHYDVLTLKVPIAPEDLTREDAILDFSTTASSSDPTAREPRRPSASKNAKQYLPAQSEGGCCELLLRPQRWYDRRLARIHRYTLNRLRAEIEPVGAADFMRFLFAWQHVSPSSKLTGIDGLQAVIAQLDGFEVAATAWEKSILPARIDAYEPQLLDMLCLAGEVGWARLSPAQTSVVGATPIALFLREHADAWQSLRGASEIVLSERARAVLDTLQSKGACFARDLGDVVHETGEALAELVSAGLIASDGFAGLRTLVNANARANFADAGRSSADRGWTMPSRSRRACCCGATASSSAGYSPARRTRRPGAS
jgi:hypothetical protein